jgi:hypothetical protein
MLEGAGQFMGYAALRTDATPEDLDAAWMAKVEGEWRELERPPLAGDGRRQP